MTDRTSSTRAARVGGRPLARAAVLALLALLASPAHAQTWEVLPSPLLPTDPYPVPAVDFLYGEGAQASDPAADTLVMFNAYGTFLYNPSGAAGAAGSNGEYGVWHRVEPYGASDGLVTAAGTFVRSQGAFQPGRATGRGRRWTHNYDVNAHLGYFETEHAAPVGALFTGIGDGGETARSLADGVPGSWIQAGTGFGFPESFGEVPPSAALPNGRILMGVWNGALYSDDGGLSYTRSNAFGNARYIVWSFAFLPQPGHPYGGTAYAGMHNTALGPGPAAEVHRSDDGGATWVLAHRFTAAELDLPVFTGQSDVDVQDVTALVAAPDGSLFAAVGFGGGASNPARGGIARSLDGGTTWSRADEGFRDETGRGYQTDQLKLSRTGVLYAATERGVWRTTTPVVGGEASPVEAPGEIGVSVRPNPAGGRVEVVVSLAQAGPLRVVVLDALGREVAVVFDGKAAAGERVVGVDPGSWPAGVYVVRATAGARIASARLVVAR